MYEYGIFRVAIAQFVGIFSNFIIELNFRFA